MNEQPNNETLIQSSSRDLQIIETMPSAMRVIR